MKRYLFHHFRYIVSATAVLLFSSCVKEGFNPDNSSRRIIPTFKSVLMKSQQSAAPGELISRRVVSSSDGFDLVERVYENNSRQYGDGYTTKGSAVTDDTLESFGINAYAEGDWHDTQTYSAGLYFKAISTRSGAGWSLSKTDGPAKEGTGDEAGALYWINDIPLTFWSYNDVEPERLSTYKAKFSYTVSSDVSAQKDPVFAFSKENRKFYDSGSKLGQLESQSSTSNATDNKVNIWFYHALSPVQFHKDKNLTDYSISNIEIQDVYSHTECEIDGTDNVAGAGSPNITFNHVQSILASFSQAYGTDDASLVEPEDFATRQNGRFNEEDGKTFFMIPQTLGESTKLKVTFTYTGGDKTTSPVFDFNGTWEAGKYYVYTIDLKGNVRVDIQETCTDTDKSDVKFLNASNVNEYIRAAVVANWFNADGDIVAPWDRTRDGDIALCPGWTEHNGFYYFEAPVATQEYTGNLFDSFTRPVSAPVTGAHMEMTVLVQAVASDGIDSCFEAF